MDAILLLLSPAGRKAPTLGDYYNKSPHYSFNHTAEVQSILLSKLHGIAVGRMRAACVGHSSPGLRHFSVAISFKCTPSNRNARLCQCMLTGLLTGPYLTPEFLFAL